MIVFQNTNEMTSEEQIIKEKAGKLIICGIPFQIDVAPVGHISISGMSFVNSYLKFSNIRDARNNEDHLLNLTIIANGNTALSNNVIFGNLLKICRMTFYPLFKLHKNSLLNYYLDKRLLVFHKLNTLYYEKIEMSKEKRKKGPGLFLRKLRPGLFYVSYIFIILIFFNRNSNTIIRQCFFYKLTPFYNTNTRRKILFATNCIKLINIF